jgi:hypothetical protein
VFVPFPSSNALVVRVLLALVHKNPKIADQVLTSLCAAFSRTIIDQISLSIVLSSIGMVLEAAAVEGVILSKDTLSSLSYILIVGFAEAKFTVRRRLFEILRLLSTVKGSQFWLQKFLTNCESELSFHAMRRVMQSMSMIRDGEVRLLESLMFTQVCLASVPNLYLFYVSSFGHSFRREANSDERRATLHETRKLLIKLLPKCNVVKWVIWKLIANQNPSVAVILRDVRDHAGHHLSSLRHSGSLSSQDNRVHDARSYSRTAPLRDRRINGGR